MRSPAPSRGSGASPLLPTPSRGHSCGRPAASVPVPRFAHLRHTRCEPRNQRDTSNVMTLVPL
jgi:hypothetical protein